MNMTTGFNTYHHADFSSKGKRQAKPRQVADSLNQLPANVNAVDASLSSTNFEMAQQQHNKNTELFDTSNFATPHNTLSDIAPSGVEVNSEATNIFNWQQATIQRVESWGENQARAWFDCKPIDNFVKTTFHAGKETLPSRNMTAIFFNEAGEQSLVGLSQVGSQTYWQQIATKSTALKEAISSGLKNPKSLLPVAGELAHASWTRSFTEAFAGNNVVSNGLSAIGSGLFVFNAGHKTLDAYNAAKADGQTGGQLTSTTMVEGVKNVAAAGAIWFMGDVGATLFRNLLGSEIKSWKGTKLARFSSLPAQLAAIIGAVLFGTAAQGVISFVLPSYQSKINEPTGANTNTRIE